MTGTSAPASNANCPNRSGTVLAGRYRLQRRIAVGGMGEVYAATHVDIPRRFAIKLLRPEFTRDAQMQGRFRLEAETAARLSSEHVVDVADFGHGEDGSPYIAMELLEGTDLRRLLASRGRLGVPDACELIAQACAGLAVAHRHGVIHRDLKPENLFLTQRGTRALLKVLDFGIAKLRNQSLGTASGSLLGTPEYMPPEQVRGGAAIDERADLYALGAILYELLTGRLPHPGEEQHEIISHVLFEPPLPLLELRPELPTELACIVHRALAPDPDERFRSVGELAEALAAYARPETLLPIEGLDTAETVTPPARASESRVATQAVQRSTKPKRVYAALLSLTALAAVFAYRLQRTAAPQVRQLPAISIQSAPHVAASLKLPLHSLTSAGDVASMEPTAVAVERPAPAAEQPKPPIMRARRPERPRASPAVLSPSGPPSTIEVLRGERTIIFKRDNPLRSD